MTRDIAPVHMRRKGLMLEPASAMDAEKLASYANGSEVEVTIRQRRSGPQHRLYWAMLANVVTATGGDPYPTAEHLHEALKIRLGYVKLVKALDSDIKRVLPDSTAFNAMDQAEFKAYFDKAVAAIAEGFGFDPLKNEMAA